ncbi:Der1-like family-domain-containing protein [Talaromyces proteolyticus]|uniref:Derlin n=1 Tax=Talaromyces proteolyticus TaxID=1131652 RepID=A0AAD4KYK6_9EURO|nr:Der1-like family-domain-containing protein [Talaromyces proteolyticus]KAH8702625.1 Der1-like family-domain-containing protein [Talaromyces proteolyticus]
MDVFWAAPPVARTLTALTFVESVLVYGGFLGGWRVVFLPERIFHLPPDFWRFVTPFLLTGRQMAFIFDLYFMYTYASGLETKSPRFARTGDFLTYIVFVCVVIMFLANFFLGGMIFTSALIMALVHTWAQDNRGRQVTFYVIQIKAELLPAVMLLVTMVSSGWGATMLEGTGLVASHLYDFLTRIWPLFGGGRNYIFTPAFVHRLLGDSNTNVHGFSGTYGTSPGSTAGSSSSSNSWSRRGAGRRLG